MRERLAPREAARYTPILFAAYASPYPYQVAPHLELLSNKLLEAATEPDKRVIVSMPPRHGKSELTSHYFPPWYLCNWPNKQLLFAAYESTFAAEWGGKSRDTAQEFGEEVFGVHLDKDNSSRDNWRVFHGDRTPGRELQTRAANRQSSRAYSIMRTAGLGGPVTGKGADLAIVDDPVKNNEDALSVASRENKWQWWQSTMYPRLHKNGSAIVVQCMTGDTPVLMADGTERPLRDVRSGDHIATYEEGKLAVSTVEKHRSNGCDHTFTIKTTFGRILQANERHPFLVEEDGCQKWIRLRDLTTDHSLVVSGQSAARGRERPVARRDVGGRSAPRGFVSHTTTRPGGRRGTAGGQRKRTAAHTSNTATASPWMSTTPWPKRRAGDVQYVGSYPETMFEPTGAEGSALTIVTTPAPLEPFCATTVILQSGTQKQSAQHSPWSNTSDFTTERIASIEPSGVEEVFDLQVARTENFIANGAVSHNTRWHEDDLAGRLIEISSEGKEHWEVINLPALAEENDILGREVGEPLWPEMFDESRLKKIREVQGPYWFSAMYQGRPAPLEGGYFKRAWFNERYDKLPQMHRVIQTVDAAFKTGLDNDYSVIATWGTDGRNYYVIDIVRAKLEFHELKSAMKDQFWKHQPSAVYVEEAAAGISILQEFQRESALPVIGKPVFGNDISRALAITGICEARKVRLPAKGAPWVADWVEEHIAFPNATHDDQVATSYYALEELAYAGMPIMEFVG